MTFWRFRSVLDFPAVAFLIVLTVAYLIVWANSGLNPMEEGLGWNGWWDQSNYFKSASALAHFDFRASEHWYPIGYAILGAPFVYITAAEPYFIPNLFFLLAFGLLFLGIFRPIIGAWASIASFLIATLLPLELFVPHHVSWPILLQFVVPWSSVPVGCYVLAVILVVRDIESTRDELSADLVLGLLAGALLVTRPSDIGPIAVAGLFYLRKRINNARPFFHLLVALAGVFLVVAPVGALTVYIHGSLLSEYTRVSQAIGVDFSNIVQRSYAVIVDARPVFSVPLSIFIAQPWLALCAPLSIVWAISNKNTGSMVLLASAASIITYLSYNDFSPLNVFKYYLIHYIVWVLPVFVAGGIAGLLVVWQRRYYWRLVVVALPFCALALTKQIPIPVGLATYTVADKSYDFVFPNHTDIDAIDLPGATTTADAGGTLEEVSLSVDGRVLELFRGYRLFEIAGGLRILLNTDIRASRIEVRLPDSITLPAAGKVAAVRFEFVPKFWP